MLIVPSVSHGAADASLASDKRYFVRTLLMQNAYVASIRNNNHHLGRLAYEEIKTPMMMRSVMLRLFFGIVYFCVEFRTAERETQAGHRRRYTEATVGIFRCVKMTRRGLARTGFDMTQPSGVVGWNK